MLSPLRRWLHWPCLQLVGSQLLAATVGIPFSGPLAFPLSSSLLLSLPCRVRVALATVTEKHAALPGWTSLRNFNNHISPVFGVALQPSVTPRPAHHQITGAALSLLRAAVQLPRPGVTLVLDLLLPLCAPFARVAPALLTEHKAASREGSTPFKYTASILLGLIHH